jgi:predicted transcriptional regulator
MEEVMATENPQMTTQTVKIEAELLMRLKIHAAKTSSTQQDILHTALVEFLDRHEKSAAQPKARRFKTI